MISVKFFAILVILSMGLCYQAKNKREMLTDFDYLVSQLYVQQCTFVEVGEGVCSLFVELPLETRSCSKKLVNRQIYFGNCLCSEFRSWQLCSRQLKLQRPDDCVFEEGVTCPTSSARVHHRLCDITGMSQWNPQCNCSITLAGMPQDPLCGFRTCYSNPLPVSICQPRSVCGTARCDLSLHGALYSIKCDRKCKEHQSFCERSGPPTSALRIVKSEWSEWQPFSCDDKSNIQQFEAECLDSEKKPAFDCLGPGMFCCSKDDVDCICEVKQEDGHLKVFRYTITFGRSLEQDHSAFKVRSAGFRGQAKVWNRFLDIASKEDNSDSLFSNHKELKNNMLNFVSGPMNMNNSLSEKSGRSNSSEALYYNILNFVNGSTQIQGVNKSSVQPNQIINKFGFQNFQVPNMSSQKSIPNQKKETITKYFSSQINGHNVPQPNIVPVMNKSASSAPPKETSVMNVPIGINNINGNKDKDSNSIQQSEYNDLLKDNKSKYHFQSNQNKEVITTTNLTPGNNLSTPITTAEKNYIHANIAHTADSDQNDTISHFANTTYDNNTKHNTTNNINILSEVGTNTSKQDEHNITTTDLKTIEIPKIDNKNINSNSTKQETQENSQEQNEDNNVHENYKEKSSKEEFRHSNIKNEKTDLDQSDVIDQSSSEIDRIDKGIQPSLSDQNNYKGRVGKKEKGKSPSQMITDNVQGENNLNTNLDSRKQTNYNSITNKHMIQPDTANKVKSTNETCLDLLFSSSESTTSESVLKESSNNECTTICLDLFVTPNKSQTTKENISKNVSNKINNLFKTQTTGFDYNSGSNNKYKYGHKNSEMTNGNESFAVANNLDTTKINSDSYKKQSKNQNTNKINGESSDKNHIILKPEKTIQTDNSSLIQSKSQETQNRTTKLPVFISDIENLFPNETRAETASKNTMENTTKASINLKIKTMPTVDPIVNLGMKLLKSNDILHDQKDPINLMSRLDPVLPVENNILQTQNDVYDEPEPVLKDLNKENIDDNMVQVLNNMVDLKHEQQRPTWIENKGDKMKLQLSQDISNVGSYKDKLEAPTEVITTNKGVQMDSLVQEKHKHQNTS